MSADRAGESNAGAGPAAGPRRVFISYSHDSAEHDERVLGLANQLRAEGIDAWIDQFEQSPAEGWQRWMQRQIERADFVIMICTPVYKQRFEGNADPGQGRAVSWKGQLIQQLLHDAGGRNQHIVPVVFDDVFASHGDGVIPLSLRSYTFYRLPSGHDALYRRFTSQPAIVPAPVGQVRAMPPRQPAGGVMAPVASSPAIPTTHSTAGGVLEPIQARSTGVPPENPGAAPGDRATATRAALASGELMTTSPSHSAIKVLFLAANPVDKTRLALDREFRAISERVRTSRYRDRVELHSEWAVRPRDLQDKLLWHQPHIVHFSGHGLSDRILLVDDHARAFPVSGAALQQLFATLTDNIRVIVFNACFSDDQARGVTESVDTAIGMHKAMGDRDAITFASAFYMALGHGRSIQKAFDVGVTELVLHNATYQHEPVLHVREGVNADGIVLLPPVGPDVVAPAKTTPGPALSRSDLERALGDLFKSMFSPKELHKFLRRSLGTDLADEMPSPESASSKAMYAADVAEKLMDRGKVKAQFLRDWAEARPEHAAAIYALMPGAAPAGGLPPRILQARTPPSAEPQASVPPIPSSTNPSTTSEPTSIEYLDELTRDEQDQLVQLLCKCIVISDQDKRALVLAHLDDEISRRISSSQILDTHVTQIVKICTAFDGGIEKLRDAVYRFEGGTRTMKRVDKLLTAVAERQADKTQTEIIRSDSRGESTSDGASRLLDELDIWLGKYGEIRRNKTRVSVFGRENNRYLKYMLRSKRPRWVFCVAVADRLDRIDPNRLITRGSGANRSANDVGRYEDDDISSLRPIIRRLAELIIEDEIKAVFEPSVGHRLPVARQALEILDRACDLSGRIEHIEAISISMTSHIGSYQYGRYGWPSSIVVKVTFAKWVEIPGIDPRELSGHTHWYWLGAGKRPGFFTTKPGGATLCGAKVRVVEDWFIDNTIMTRLLGNIHGDAIRAPTLYSDDDDWPVFSRTLETTTGVVPDYTPEEWTQLSITEQNLVLERWTARTVAELLWEPEPSFLHLTANKASYHEYLRNITSCLSRFVHGERDMRTSLIDKRNFLKLDPDALDGSMFAVHDACVSFWGQVGFIEGPTVSFWLP